MPDNKKIARRVFEEMWNGRKPELAKELHTDTFELNDPYVPMKEHGIEAAKKYFAFWDHIVPDLKFTIQEQIAEGDTVVTRLLASGTHKGEIMGIPPTNKKATIPCISIFRFEKDRIAESYVMWDAYAFFTQVGALGKMKPELVSA